MSVRDLFVIGGGPAGLAVAIAARQRGLDVAVADGARPPIDKTCGEGILPDGVEAARALGVRLDGFPLRGIRFHDGGTTADASFPQSGGMGMRRTALHEALVARAEDLGVRLLWGAPVGDLDAIRAGWVVGADGAQSRVRRWAGLDGAAQGQRYGFRRHCPMAPRSDCVEIYWHDGFQVYITPVAPSEISVAVLSRARPSQLDLSALLEAIGYKQSSRQLELSRGAVTVMRRLPAVTRGRIALIGDASGSVDAITGEGLSLAFRQGIALAGAIAANDLSLYEAAHRQLARRRRLMARALLLLDRRPTLRHAAIHAFAACPPLFARLLALHVGTTTASPRSAARVSASALR